VIAGDKSGRTLIGALFFPIVGSWHTAIIGAVAAPSPENEGSSDVPIGLWDPAAVSVLDPNRKR